MTEEKHKLSRREFLVLGGKGAALAFFVASCGPTPEPEAPAAEQPTEAAAAPEEPAQ